MNTVKMRQELREAGIHVPRSNKDLQDTYRTYKEGSKPNEVSKTNVVQLASSNVYTYVGSGETPPHMIDFMGQQKFIRGEATEIKPNILHKVKNNPSFVKGSVDKETLFQRDKDAKAEADKQREEDVKVQIMAERQNRGK